MKYDIEYAVLCHKGNVRSKNQDNFWCAGIFLESENNGLAEILTGTIEAKTFPAFAVFDGMGGEQQGEMAAYIAAIGFNEFYQENPKTELKQFLLDACKTMNMKICEHQKEKNIRRMGTTVASIMFGEKDIYICNVGDSRIYQYSGKALTQISHDHSETSVTDRKPPLTQNLGIPETDFIIEPYIAKGVYNKGDRYLLCSDGLTDMVSDEEISNILTMQKSTADAAKALMDKALENGGRDNITIILCELKKRKRFFNRNKNKNNMGGTSK